MLVVDILDARASRGVVDVSRAAVDLNALSTLACIVVPVEGRLAQASALIGVPVLVGRAPGGHTSTLLAAPHLRVSAFSPARDATPVSIRPDHVGRAKTTWRLPACDPGANAFASSSTARATGHAFHSLRAHRVTALLEIEEAAASVFVPGGELTIRASLELFALVLALEAAALVIGPSADHIPVASQLAAVIFVPHAHARVEFPDTGHARSALLLVAMGLVPQADAVATEESGRLVGRARFQTADPVHTLASAPALVEEATRVAVAHLPQTSVLRSHALALVVLIEVTLLSIRARLLSASLLLGVTAAASEEQTW